MTQLMAVLPTFISLILCAANVYSMNSFRIAVKRPFLLFAVMTILCAGVNAYIILSYGNMFFRDIMLLTIAVPYFILFLLVSRDKVSQICFNFWLWVNIYAVITNFVLLVNDLALQSQTFADALRIILLCIYFVLYNKYLKAFHRRIMETPNINWWAFSLIPLFFEFLIVMTHKRAIVPAGFSRSYLMLLVIFLLMLAVYGLIVYTFRKAEAAAAAELEKTVYSQQLDAAKAQISFLTEAHAQTAFYRHDMRHNLVAIDALLSAGQGQEARNYIQKVLGSIDSLALRHFCKNNLANLLCSFFTDKADRQDIRLTVDVDFPEELHISDMEFCVILSNGLENALEAVSHLEPAQKWIQLYGSIRQENLILEIKNPFEGSISMRNGLPVSPREGHGYGCKSMRSIAEHNRGFCVFAADHHVFTMRVVLPIPN